LRKIKFIKNIIKKNKVIWIETTFFFKSKKNKKNKSNLTYQNKKKEKKYKKINLKNLNININIKGILMKK
jgi:hypothetical protein